jgi:hypothetical protein
MGNLFAELKRRHIYQVAAVRVVTPIDSGRSAEPA